MNARDLETLRAFYMESRQQLFTYALSITRCREAAEDAVQGVFERLLHGGALPRELRPYVFRAVRNAALDTCRRARKRTDSMFAPPETADQAVPDPAEAAAVDELDALLQQVSPDERETIVLKTYGGLTFQQIADLRQLPLPTVASWYRRGLERMRSILNPER